MVGININCKNKDWCELILNGSKTIETRNSASLTPYMGQRVGLIKTGCGEATLIGFTTIAKVKEYKSEDSFNEDYEKHRVNPEDEYGWQPDTKLKWGYVLENTNSCKPKTIKTKGIVARQINF